MFKFINCLVVLQFASGVLSLMAVLTTGVPMSPGYGGYQTATPPTPTQQQHTQQSITKPPRLQSTTTTYNAPSYNKASTALPYHCIPHRVNDSQ
jgi:hypothetical protein